MLELQTATIPVVNKHANYNATKAGKERRTNYRRSNSKWETDASYLSRRFVAWDGEGITNAFGIHLYVMLAHSEGGYIANPEGLSTSEILAFVTREGAAHGDAIHVVYGGGYDFNCFLADTSREFIRNLRTHPYYSWGNYRIQWRPGKSLFVKHGDTKGITIYDCMPFFQCPFVKACDEYLGDRFVERDMIVSNKALRSSFTVEDIPKVREYNAAELTNLVMLMDELRSRLNKVGLRPRRWDGPGAIASALLSREGVKSAMSKCPEEVAAAGRYAYAGGRFEVIRCGSVQDRCYEYDVNSAYPHALRFVPNLARGEWVKYDQRSKVVRETFGVYYLRYSGENPTIPGPLFRRHANGAISYPLNVEGWFWSPDVEVAKLHVERYGGSLEVVDGWVFVPQDELDKPFEFIEGLYAKRRALKKAGDGAHVGIKLGLNSLYGKLCQKVGWSKDRHGHFKPPPFHQLEWAGYITSYCRSLVLEAAIDDLDCVVAFETDALFTSRRLTHLKVGSNLGEWEETVFDNLTYAQSGLYFGTVDGKEISKTRGVDRCKCDKMHDPHTCGAVTRDVVESAMQAELGRDRKVSAKLTRFVGAGYALQTSWDSWRQWQVTPKEILVEPSKGKRWHVDCLFCLPRSGAITPGVWHETFCPYLNVAENYAFPIPWINPNPAMDELEELTFMGAEDAALYYD